MEFAVDRNSVAVVSGILLVCPTVLEIFFVSVCGLLTSTVYIQIQDA